MELIAASSYSLGTIYALWGFFLAVMNLKQASDKGKLNRAALVLGLPIIITGYLLDVVIQFTIGSLLLLDWPRERTLSEHLHRLATSHEGWRGRVARWVLASLLADFDPSGGHDLPTGR